MIYVELLKSVILLKFFNEMRNISPASFELSEIKWKNEFGEIFRHFA